MNLAGTMEVTALTLNEAMDEIRGEINAFTGGLPITLLSADATPTTLNGSTPDGHRTIVAYWTVRVEWKLAAS